MKETRVLEKQKITVEGVSEITWMHNGVASQAPAFDTSEWADNLKTMFQWQCTSSQTSFKLSNDCEEGHLVGIDQTPNPNPRPKGC